MFAEIDDVIQHSISDDVTTERRHVTDESASKPGDDVISALQMTSKCDMDINDEIASDMRVDTVCI